MRENIDRVIEEIKDIKPGEYLVYQVVDIPNTLDGLGFMPIGNPRYIKGELYGHTSWSDPRLVKDSFFALYMIARTGSEEWLRKWA